MGRKTDPDYKRLVSFSLMGPESGALCEVDCTDGKISRGCLVRVLRDNIVVHEGELASLRRFKDDVKEVASGYECGIQIEKFNDIKVGDIIECFVMEQINA